MKIALLFPGQGSQSTGMLKALAEQFPQVEKRFSEASEIIKTDLWAICQTENHHLLNATAYTQPILLAGSMACYDVLKAETGISGDFFGGHSLGEYTALSASGAMAFSEAIDLVHTRGQLMQDAVQAGEGAMAAILGLEDEQVAEACEKVGAGVSPANYNSVGQVVIAGKTDAVNQTIEVAKEMGAKRAVLLPVSVPSHCELMRPAAAKLSAYLERIQWKNPSAPIVYNVDGKIRAEINGVGALLGAQLYQPVLWTTCVKNLKEAGADLMIEVGAGKVLTGLIKRIDKTIQALSFEQPSDIETVKNAIKNEE